jgi:putative transposase
MGLVQRDDGWRIPDVLWAQIEPLIPPGREHPLGCHNPRVPARNAMNAILFVLRTGCQWNALKATGICASSSAHRRFVEWTEAGVFEKAWVKALADYEEFVGIDWRWLSMDGAMSKAPLGGEKSGAEPHRSGQDRHQAQPAHRSEASGVPVAVVAAPANRNDFKLARETLESIVIKRPRSTRAEPHGLCLDKGYDYDEVRELAAEFRFTAHIRRRGEEARAIKKAAGYKARRWVVERSHSWMNRFRRILVRWEKRADTYVAMLHFACALITWKACGLLG